MTDTSSVSLNDSRRTQEANSRQYSNELKALESEYQNKYRQTIHRNEDLIKRTQKDYDVKISTMNSETDKKIEELKRRQDERIKSEQIRLDAELNDLKRSHLDRKVELKNAQENEINKIAEEHANSLDVARKKFDKEMHKYK